MPDEQNISAGMIMAALKIYGEKIDKIADVAAAAAQATQASAVEIAQLKVALAGMQKSLDRISEALSVSNKLEGRVVRLETEYANIRREAADAKAEGRKRWGFGTWVLASFIIAIVVFLLQQIFIRMIPLPS